eukprot:gb/GECH01001592.1/.p1 GENE.gb/GECH01001592.1/~~gb/GECH01001592.1/.p1  ORF type:complete len:192 (+),score=44.76 gb/GECH01001592.1/:1-576(+)
MGKKKKNNTNNSSQNSTKNKSDKYAGPHPCVIVLCGLPASGKSTFADDLERKAQWTRVCQDELGDRKECVKAMSKGIRQKKAPPFVVIDRCNHSVGERKAWIREAKSHGAKQIECIHFDISSDQCKERIKTRKGHPTIKPENGEEVIDSFMRMFRPPNMHEGFHKMHVISNSQEYRSLVQELSAYTNKPKK